MAEIYSQKDPTSRLSGTIKSFWQIDHGEDTSIVREKIIPDGYPELIFHYGDPYKINIDGYWKQQGSNLLAGQIKNHFFVENTGTNKVFGIKFQPWAIHQLFQIKMNLLTNKVIDVPKKILETLDDVRGIATSSHSFKNKVSIIDEWFLEFTPQQGPKNIKGQEAVELIIINHGKIHLSKVTDKIGISERSLERYFKTHIGLSPKYYSRIIRFSSIFKLVQESKFDWADIIFLTGFYDQSHFIKNFREFTGEDPSKYGFSDENLANLFLKC